MIHHSRSDGSPYPFEQCRICRSFRSGEHVHTDSEVFWRADGISIPVEYVARPVRREGQLVGAIVVFSDISARLKIANELQEKQSLLANVLNSIPQFVFWKDRDSRFIGSNTNFAKLWGFGGAAEIVGKTDFDLSITREEAESYHSVDEEVMRTGEPRFNFEETMHDLEGVERHLLTSKVPLFGDSGEVVGMLGVFADITERRQLEMQLRQSQKMDAIGQLTGGVAHDFNNLLTVIMGNLQLVERSIRGNERQEKQIRMAHDAARRGADLTKRLLAFSRKQVLDPVVTNVNEVIAGTEPLIRRTIGEHIKIKTILADEVAPVKIDISQFENAILNLVVNARDAMPDGGCINIETTGVT
ncbi:MAG TPA: PAS domain-containing protein, partial [Planctomycetaceae bacterium]|nr:PAS domain-containing protein [Planctomycetaceae bacterium]